MRKNMDKAPQRRALYVAHGAVGIFSVVPSFAITCQSPFLLFQNNGLLKTCKISLF
jgi:hypothetical protein